MIETVDDGRAAMRWGAGVTLAVLAAAGAMVGARAAEPDRPPPTIDVTALPAWSLMGYHPVEVVVRAYQPERLMLAFESDTGMAGYGQRVFYRARRAVSLEPGPPARFELPVMGGGQLRVVDAHGQVFNSPLSGYASHRSNFDGRRPMYMVNGFRLRESAAAVEKIGMAAGYGRGGAHTLDPTTLDLEHVPARWTSYAGLRTPFLFDADDLRALEPGRAETLARAVQFLGARIVVAGDGADRAVRDKLGFVARDARTLAGAPRGQRDFAWLTGRVTLLNDFDAAAWADGARVGNLGQSPMATYAAATPVGLQWMFEQLPGLSTRAVIGLLIGLGILLGPLNYWFVRRRGNLLLFFVTTPALAVLGAFGVFLASILMAGVFTKYAETAVLLRRAGSTDAAVYQHRVIHSGLFSPRLEYPADTALMPFREGGGELINVAVDEGDRLRLSGDWVVPRTPSGLSAYYPVAMRMDVRIEDESGVLFVVNQLEQRLRAVTARRADGTWFVATDVAPGSRAQMAANARWPLNAGDGESDLLAAASVFNIVRDGSEKASGGLLTGLDVERITLAAECEGLPYLEDGQLDGRLLEGRYYYVVAE